MAYYSDTGTAAVTTTSAIVWRYWNSGTSTASASTDTWVMWNTDSTATTSVTTSTTTDTIWVRWNNGYYEVSNDLGSLERTTPEPETAEQAAERARQYRERQAEFTRQAQEQDRLAKEAERRAEELLTEHLTEPQRLEFQKEKSFTVISKDGERRYRIRKGYSRNIERIDDNGKRLKTLCAHPAENLPDYDHMLAQKLMLEHSEDDFLKVANVS